jgi:hypothetical protein
VAFSANCQTAVSSFRFTAQCSPIPPKINDRASTREYPIRPTIAEKSSSDTKLCSESGMYVYVRALPCNSSPPERSLSVQICKIDAAQHGVSRQKEIQRHHRPSRPRHPFDLPQRPLKTRKIPQAISHKNAIERCIRKWQSRRVRASRFRQTARSRQPQHRLRQIHGYGSGSRQPPQNQLRKITCPRREIKHHRIFRQNRPRDSQSLPSPVHPIRKHARDEIVARRDFGKHLAHQPQVVCFHRRCHFLQRILSSLHLLLGPSSLPFAADAP